MPIDENALFQTIFEKNSQLPISQIMIEVAKAKAAYAQAERSIDASPTHSPTHSSIISTNTIPKEVQKEPAHDTRSAAQGQPNEDLNGSQTQKPKKKRKKKQAAALPLVHAIIDALPEETRETTKSKLEEEKKANEEAQKGVQAEKVKGKNEKKAIKEQSQKKDFIDGRTLTREDLVVDPNEALHDDYIICCICGVEKSSLRIHLQNHNITPSQYRKLCGYDRFVKLSGRNYRMKNGLNISGDMIRRHQSAAGYSRVSIPFIVPKD